MKILHTSDWHLNSTLNGRKRNDDLCRSLEQIQGYLAQKDVDVMIISGDLFRERSRPEQIQEGIQIIKKYLLTFIRRGGTVIAITGNHDSAALFSTLRDAQELVAIGPEEQGGFNATGRFYFAPNVRVLRLKDRVGQVVQFLLMPYPTTRYLRDEEQTRFQSIEERNRFIKETYLTVLQRQLTMLDPQWPTVLVSHITVRGATVASHHLLTESNEVILDGGDLPASLAYIALGHLHRPGEAIPNAPHIRYVGSIERMDYGERDDRKSVVFLEMKDSRLVGMPELLPLQSTTFYEVEVTDPATQIPRLREQYPDYQQALVRYILHWDSLTQSREELCRQIEEIFPRWYDRTLKDTRTDIVTDASLEVHQTQDVTGTTRHYLQGQLAGKEHAEEILQLAERLLAELAGEEVLG